jgi:hypothetical protein
MIRRALPLLVCLLAAPAFAGAGTTLFDDGRWRVVGLAAGAEPLPIALTRDDVALGSFSALEVSYDLGTGFTRVLSLLADGRLEPTLPPPGEAGAVAVLGRYFECDGGLTGPLRIAAIELPERAKEDVLPLRGTLSNFDSLISEKLRIDVQEPREDLVRIALSYRLRATRDFCVDRERRETQEEFRIVELRSSYVSPAAHSSDLVRYVRRLELDCDPFDDCDVDRITFCVPLANETGYVIDDPKRLHHRDLELFHTSTLPDATPTLAVVMRTPSPGSVRPQGFVTASADPAARNVALWADWVESKREYRAGRTVGRVSLALEASPPRVPGCNRTQN